MNNKGRRLPAEVLTKAGVLDLNAVLVVTAVLGFLGTIVSVGAMESSSGTKWGKYIAALLCLSVILWLGSVVLLVVFFPGSSTPDPRF